MLSAGSALSWTGAQIYSRSDSTFFEEYPLSSWEAVLRWYLELKLHQPGHPRQFLAFEVSVVLHLTHWWYSLGQRGTSYSSPSLSSQTSSYSWEVSSYLVCREGSFSLHPLSRTALEIIEQNFPHQLGVVYYPPRMPKFLPHFLSWPALELIGQHFPHHLGVVYSLPRPYLGELKIPVLLFDDNNGSAVYRVALILLEVAP